MNLTDEQIKQAAEKYVDIILKDLLLYPSPENEKNNVFLHLVTFAKSLFKETEEETYERLLTTMHEESLIKTKDGKVESTTIYCTLELAKQFRIERNRIENE